MKSAIRKLKHRYLCWRGQHVWTTRQAEGHSRLPRERIKPTLAGVTEYLQGEYCRHCKVAKPKAE